MHAYEHPSAEFTILVDEVTSHCIVWVPKIAHKKGMIDSRQKSMVENARLCQNLGRNNSGNAITEQKGVDVASLQSKENPKLPRLPPNARYLHHANECYDWGSFGWVLDQVPEDDEPACTPIAGQICCSHDCR